MGTPRVSRPIPLALTMLVALFSALVALAVAGGHNAAAHENGDQHATSAVAHAPVITPRVVAFHDEMRRLWEDHVTWTRLAIISLTSGTPDTEATVGRLLENQTDIGNAIKPFYGEPAGQELTRLLRDHILIAADLIAAAKAGDETMVAEAQARWTANADEIAAFLAGANPRSWDLDEMKEMLHEHLRLTANEALARLQGDWAADVAAYDEIHLQALGMADMLSNGIVTQFPARFHWPHQTRNDSAPRPSPSGRTRLGAAAPNDERSKDRADSVTNRDVQTKTTGERHVDEVVRWRREQLAESGFSRRLAVRVANDARYDLHALIELVERGCPPELATRILAPLNQATSPA